MSDSSTACSGYTGNKFVTVIYNCEPSRQSCSCSQFTNNGEVIVIFVFNLEEYALLDRGIICKPAKLNLCSHVHLPFPD